MNHKTPERKEKRCAKKNLIFLIVSLMFLMSCKEEDKKHLYFRDVKNNVCAKYELLENGDFKLVEEIPDHMNCNLELSMTVETYQFFRREYKKLKRKEKDLQNLQIELESAK